MTEEKLNAMKIALKGMSSEEILATARTMTLSASQTAAALAASGMAADEIAASLAAEGFSKNATTAALASIGLTEKQIETATAATAFAAAETTATTATSAFGAAVRNAAKGLWTFLTTDPVGWAIMAAGAIFALVKVVDALTVSFDEAAEKAEESKRAYEETQSKIKSLNSELETTQERMDELEAKGSLTIVEQEELTNLRATNDLLQEQLEIEKAIAEYRGLKARNDAKAALNNKGFILFEDGTATKSTFWTEAGAANSGMTYKHVDEIDYAIAQQKRLNELTKQRNKLTEEMAKKSYPNGASEAELTDYERRIENIDKLIAESGEEVGTYLETILEYKNTISDPVTGEAYAGFEEDIQRINELTNLVTESRSQISSEAQKKQEKIDSFINRPSLEKDIAAVKQLAKELNGISLVPDNNVDQELDKLKTAMDSAAEQYNRMTNGNLDYLKRPVVDAAKMLAAGWDDFEGEFATTFSSAFTEGNFTFSITPILDNGDVLSPQALYDYISNLVTDGTADDLLASDPLNLIINYQPGDYDGTYWEKHENDLQEVKDAHLAAWQEYQNHKIGTEISSDVKGISLSDFEKQFPELVAAAQQAGIDIEDVINSINSSIGSVNITEAAAQIRAKMAQAIQPQDAGDLVWRQTEERIEQFIARLDESEIKILYQIVKDNDTGSWSLEDFDAALKRTKEDGDIDVSRSIQSYEQLKASTDALVGARESLNASFEDGEHLTDAAYNSISELAGGEENLAEIVDKENGYLIKNADALQTLIVKSQRQLSANLKLASSHEKLKHHKLVQELKQVVTQVKNYDSATKKLVSSLKDQIRQAQLQIQQFEMLKNQILGVVDAYDRLANAKQLDEAFDYTDDFAGAMQDFLALFEDGAYGTETFWESMRDLVPEDVYSQFEDAGDQIKAGYQYIQNVLSKYFTNDDGSITITSENAKAFIEEGLKNGALVGSLDNFDLSPAIESVQDLENAYNITTTAAFSLMTAIGKFVPEGKDIFDGLTPKTLEGDILAVDQKILSVTESIDTLKKSGKTATDEGKAELRQLLDQLTEYDGQLDQLGQKSRENIQENIGLDEQMDTALEKVKELEKALSDYSPDTLNYEFHEDELNQARQAYINLLAQKLQLEEPTELTISIALESVQDEIDEVQGQLDRIADFDGETYTVKANVDASQTDVDALAEQLAALETEKHEIEAYVNSNDEEVISALEEIETFTIHDKPFSVKANTSAAWDALNELEKKTLTDKTLNVTVNETTKKSGKSNAGGTSHAGGSAGLPHAEHNALVGELGRELEVDPNTGTYQTVGDNGAEMVDLPKGAIIFDHKQTEDLLKRGHTNSRGKALVKGNAHLTWVDPIKTTTSGGTSSGSDSSSDGSDVETWFERAYKYHQHLLAMDKENIKEYLEWLNAAYKQAYAQQIIELDDYYKYEEEVWEKQKDWMEKLRGERENAISGLKHLRDDAAKKLWIGNTDIASDITKAILRTDLTETIGKASEIIEKAAKKVAETGDKVSGASLPRQFDATPGSAKALNELWEQVDRSKYRWKLFAPTENGGENVSPSILTEYFRALRDREMPVSFGLTYTGSTPILDYINAHPGLSNDEVNALIMQDLPQGALLQSYNDTLEELGRVLRENGLQGFIDDITQYWEEAKAGNLGFYEGQSAARATIYAKYSNAPSAQNLVESNLEAMQSEISNALRSNDFAKYTEGISSYYKQLMELVEEQKNYFLSLTDENGNHLYSETSDEVTELIDLWYEYRDAAVDAVTTAYETLRDHQENAITLNENWLDNAINAGKYDDVRKYADNIAAYYKQMQDSLHEEAEYYRSLGYSDTSDEVSELSNLWYEYEKKRVAAAVDAWAEIVDAAHDAVDEIHNVYDSLHSAADEYASMGGYLTIDTYQKLLKLGPQYLQYLKDENGQLVIDEVNIRKVIAAKMEQLAVDNAMTYVERLGLALRGESTEKLNDLLYATKETTDATWDLVYSTLAYLDLTDDQYRAALHNINAIRALGKAAVDGIGRSSDELSASLDSMQDGLDDLLKYIMDMLKQRVEDQIDALEDMKDAYSDIIDMKKESLEKDKEAADRQKTMASKMKEIAKLQAKIDAINLAADQGDRKAIAERASLMEEMEKLQEDLADTQVDYTLDAQKDALDEMEQAYHDEKDAEIEYLKDSISSTEKLYRMAMDYLDNEIGADYERLKGELIAWNYEVGNSFESEIVSAWESAISAAERYGSLVSAMKMLPSELESISNSSGYGSDGSTDNRIVADTGAYDAQAQQAKKVAGIITDMKQNSRDWHNATESGQQYLEKENEDYADQIAGIIGKKVYKVNGVWYIEGGEELYKKYAGEYHTGGDVDRLGRDEVFAKLKYGETVLDEDTANELVGQIDRMQKMQTAFRDMATSIDNSILSDFIRPDGSTINNVTNNNSNQPIEIIFGDTNINGAAPDAIQQHFKLTEDMKKEIARWLGFRF